VNPFRVGSKRFVILRSRGKVDSLSLTGRRNGDSSGLTLLSTGDEYRTRVGGIAKSGGRRFLLLLLIIFVILYYTIIEPLYVSI
jgi:hypothetical protein